MLEVAGRAGIGRSAVLGLDAGTGATLENLLRVATALGVLDGITGSLDPHATDVGRLRRRGAAAARSPAEGTMTVTEVHVGDSPP